jgi:hypothetical protein
MCLRIDKGKVMVLSANKDIPVVKILQANNLSAYHGFPYAANTLYELGKPLCVDEGESWLIGSNLNRVYEGFHSYDSLDTAKCHDLRNGHKPVAFFIPEGTQYIMGKYGEIVSAAIRSGDLYDLFRKKY